MSHSGQRASRPHSRHIPSFLDCWPSLPRRPPRRRLAAAPQEPGARVRARRPRSGICRRPSAVQSRTPTPVSPQPGGPAGAGLRSIWIGDTHPLPLGSSSSKPRPWIETSLVSNIYDCAVCNFYIDKSGSICYSSTTIATLSALRLCQLCRASTRARLDGAQPAVAFCPVRVRTSARAIMLTIAPSLDPERLILSAGPAMRRTCLLRQICLA